MMNGIEFVLLVFSMFLIGHSIKTLEFTIASSGHGRRKAAVAQAPAPSKGQNQLVFADQRLAVVYPIIQKFKNIITSDPLGVTKSWVGPNICNYIGFYCKEC